MFNFKKLVVSTVLVCYSSMSHAGLLDLIKQGADLIQQGVDLVDNTAKIVSGDASGVAQKSEQRAREKARAEALSKHTPTTKMPWFSINYTGGTTNKKEFDEQAQLLDQFNAALQTLPFNKDTPKYSAKDLAVEGLEEFDPAAPDAEARIKRFKVAMSDLAKRDQQTMTLDDYERLSKDVLPVLRFLKHYKDAYDPVMVPVPPQSGATFKSNGYCLDKTLAGPKGDVPLKIVPVNSRVDPRIQYLYDAVNRLQFEPVNSKTAQQKYQRQDIQDTLWTIRHARQPSPNSQVAKILRDAWPGGDRVMADYSKNHEDAVRDHQELIDYETKQAKASRNLSMPANFDWGTARSISNISNGVLTKTVTTDNKLSTQTHMLNPTAKPIFVDTTKYVAEPRWDNQTLSMAYYNQSASEPSAMEKSAANRLLKNFADLGLVDKDVYKKWSKDNKGAFQMIGFLMGNVPVVGNCLNAYTALTGCDPFTGDNVEGLDYVMAVAGIVPGGQYLKGFGAVINPKTASHLVRLYEGSQSALGGKAYVEAGYNNVMDIYEGLNPMPEEYKRPEMTAMLERALRVPEAREFVGLS